MLSIILPTYNERGNIALLVKAILEKVSKPLELLIVDDDSPDHTWEVAQELEREFQEVRLIRRTGERGLTLSLNEGFAHSKGEKVLWMDADFSMPPETISRLVALLDTYPVVIGSRYTRGGKDLRDSRLAVSLSLWFNSVARRLLGGVSDYTTGFVAAQRNVVETIGLSGKHGDYCIRFLCQAKRAGYAIKEIPYTCRPRRTGRSKTFASPWRLLRYGTGYLWTLCLLSIRR